MHDSPVSHSHLPFVFKHSTGFWVSFDLPTFAQQRQSGSTPVNVNFKICGNVTHGHHFLREPRNRLSFCTGQAHALWGSTGRAVNPVPLFPTCLDRVSPDTHRAMQNRGNQQKTNKYKTPVGSPDTQSGFLLECRTSRLNFPPNRDILQMMNL